MSRFTASIAAVALLTGCAGKPVNLRGAYSAPPEAALPAGTLALTIFDTRGAGVRSVAQTRTLDMPDTANTDVTVIGNTAYATTTYRDNDVTITTGQTMGLDLVEDVDNVMFAWAEDEGWPMLKVSALTSEDEAGLRRAADEYGFDRIVYFAVDDYRFWTDASGNSYAWAYLGGATLGLAAPFIPFERWDASITISGTIKVWDRREGFVGRRAFSKTYRQRGKGIPSYKRVFVSVSTWADRAIARDVMDEMASLSGALQAPARTVSRR